MEDAWEPIPKVVVDGIIKIKVEMLVYLKKDTPTGNWNTKNA